VEPNNENDADEYKNVIKHWIDSKVLLDMEYFKDAIPGASPGLSIAAQGTLEVMPEPTGDLGNVLILKWHSGKFQMRLLGVESYYLGRADELRAVVVVFSPFEKLKLTEVIDTLEDAQ